MTLDILLASLNAAIDSWNMELDQAVEEGELEPERAATLKVAPGSATVEMVWNASRPHGFARATECLLTSEDPDEINRLTKTIAAPTQIVRDLSHGSAKAKGMGPIAVRTIDLAHLLARAAA